MDYLQGLNDAQKTAVLHTQGPLLIVAGAGAGKTKTITHRIAHLIAGGIPGRSILAVTFTNKAAQEMRERVLRLIPAGQGAPFMSTFHTLGVRLLREFHAEAGVPKHFTIWDRDDSIRAVKAALKEMDVERYTPRQILGILSKAKGAGRSIRDYTESIRLPIEQTAAQVWEKYERALTEEGALDFEDLLIRTRVLLAKDERVRLLLQNRWQHITIDEYQDTNMVQYDIARLLTGGRMNICVVGDVDQCLTSGALVTMADGSTRPIEKIRPGDVVRSNYGSGDFRPARVARASVKKHDGALIRITTQTGRLIESTPEHMHFAGYRLGLSPQTFFVYLMHKEGKGFRLGVSQVYTRGQMAPMLGFKLRNNHEHADSVWVVDTYPTMNAARVAEYTLSLRYRIPTLPFVARKGGSTNGYVHDQVILDSIFTSFDTESAGAQILTDYGLSRAHPHHHAQSSRRRHTIVVTLCGEHRGKTPMHRLSLAASTPESRQALESLGYSVRTTTRNPGAWRFETAHKSYAELSQRLHAIKRALPEAHIVEMARLGGKKKNPKEGNSLPFMPAASIRKGMVMFDEEAGYDVIENVEQVDGAKTLVYDLDIEHVHNFIANGLITHNCLYSWRGAEIGNLLLFEKNFPGTKVVVLEENYRSTRTILAAANTVIKKNVRRVPKNLFTNGETGDPIGIYAAFSESDEAHFVAENAERLLREGVAPGEIAVLYRQNFQSRALEEAFLHRRIPYRVLGVRFFERAEVKDTLSYLRAALNPGSRADLSRIVAVPPRGIGKTTLEKILSKKEGELNAGARAKVLAFRDTLAKIHHAVTTLPVSEAVRYCLEASGLENHYTDGTEEGKERVGNLRELVNLAARWDSEMPEEGIERLLEEAALQSEQDSLDQSVGAVSLMTVHASKGLEFDAVFVTGLEQGLFPHEGFGGGDGPREERDEEEERRLFYVAVTRARTKLFLSYASERMRYGSRDRSFPSEFLSDIDERLTENLSPHRGSAAAPKRGLLDDWDEDVIR